MTVVLSTPTPNDTRSAIADWMEFQALMHPRGRATTATLSNVMDIASDNAVELDEVPLHDGGDALDNDIVEQEQTQRVESVFEELAYRQDTLGDAYPFRVTAGGRALELVSDDLINHVGHAVYIFCLLTSSIRTDAIQPRDAIRTAERRIGNIFQVCSCLAAGGYIKGEVASFGFPRAKGTDFLPALREVYGRFGYPRVIEKMPASYRPSPKDGGIDVIAWRDHPDRMPGKLYLIGQCASGEDWREKSVCTYIEPFHVRWFEKPPARFVLPAMFIPFTLHHQMVESREEVYIDMTKDLFWYEEKEFGIIFDRLRIAHYANLCSIVDPNELTKVDGIDRFNLVQGWLKSMLRQLSRQGVA